YHLSSVLFFLILRPPSSPLFPYTTLFRSGPLEQRALADQVGEVARLQVTAVIRHFQVGQELALQRGKHLDKRHVPFEGAKLGLRSEEHTSELQSLTNLVCRLLLEKKKSNS